MIFGAAHRNGFPFKFQLPLENRGLSRNDIRSLSEAAQNGRFPYSSLNLSRNILTDFMDDLFGPTLHDGYADLTQLQLKGTALSQKDVANLCKAVNNDKLPKLKELNLSQNKLADCLRDLLCKKFMSLESLLLRNTVLNGDDVQCLAEAMKTGRLQKLNDIHLEENNLGSNEEKTKNLIRICELYVKVHLMGNKLSDEFFEKMKQLSHVMSVDSSTCISCSKPYRISPFCSPPR